MKTNAERVRESLSVFQRASEQLHAARNSGAAPGYMTIINALIDPVDNHIAACRKTLNVINTGDDNNNRRLAELILMDKNSSLPREEKNSQEYLTAYQKKLRITLDPTGEEELNRLEQEAKLVEQAIFEISQKISPSIGLTTAATTMVTDAASAIGNVLPTSVSAFIAKSAQATGLRLSTDIKTELKEICATLVRDCQIPLTGNASAKTRLEAYQLKELKKVADLLNNPPRRPAPAPPQTAPFVAKKPLPQKPLSPEKPAPKASPPLKPRSLPAELRDRLLNKAREKQNDAKTTEPPKPRGTSNN